MRKNISKKRHKLDRMSKRDFSIQNLLDDSIHRWYRFVLSYPDHFVKDIIEKEELNINSIILDPFLGTGTTVVEAKRLGFFSIGIEVNPICVFASRVKSNWNLNVGSIKDYLNKLKVFYQTEIKKYNLTHPNQILNYIDSRSKKNLLKPLHVKHSLLNDKYISPIPWTKILILKKFIKTQIQEEKYRDLFLLILAKTFRTVANVKFGPEIGYIKPKVDAPVLKIFSSYIAEIIEDLTIIIKNQIQNNPDPLIISGDSRNIQPLLKDYYEKIDLVITSPPYPVDKDYTRITRLELSILDLVSNIEDVRKIKKKMVRSSTRQVYKEDNEKHKILEITEVFNISNEIRARCKRDGDTSGFSKVYPKLVEEYFGGMYSHFESLYPLLKRGAKSYYLIGDSRSFKMVHIKTAEICGLIAQKLGYKVELIEIFRNRTSTAHKDDLLENILILSK